MDFDIGKPAEYLCRGGGQFGTSEMSPETQVYAIAESQVLVAASLRIEPVRILEPTWIAVGGHVVDQDLAALRNLDAFDLGVLQGHSLEMR